MYASMLYLFRVIYRKSPILTYPPAFGSTVMTPFEFLRDLRYQKTKTLGHAVVVIPQLVVSVEH